MSDAGERTTQVPAGATAITAKDIITQPAPEKLEAVEYWMLKSSAGVTETLRLRVEIGDKAKLQLSPLDQSVLGIHFEFHGGEKNEITGRRYVPANNLFFYDQAFVKEPVYKDGESPFDMEMKRRARAVQESLQKRAARMAEGLDKELDDETD